MIHGGGDAYGAAILDPGWRENLGRDYGDIAWAETGERLTEESFHRFREEQPDGRLAPVDRFWLRPAYRRASPMHWPSASGSMSSRPGPGSRPVPVVGSRRDR